MTRCTGYFEDPDHPGERGICALPATRRIQVVCADCGRTYGARAFCDSHEPTATKSAGHGFDLIVLPL